MKKKIFALALAAVMLVSGAMTAMAATTEVDCSGWWVAFSDAYEVDEDGLELTFKNTTYESATANWNGPIYVVYEGTTEKAVMRGDLYGWSVPDGTAEEGYELVSDGTYSGYWVNTNNNNWAVRGYTFEKTAEPADWTTYLTALKAGADCSVKASIENNVLTVVFTVADVVSTATYPVSGTETVTIVLGGELCKLSEITEVVKEVPSETTTESNTEDNIVDEKGDLGSVAYMVLLAGAALVVVAFVSKKKFA